VHLTTALAFDAAHRILGHPAISQGLPSGVVPERETPKCCIQISRDGA